MTYRRAWSIGFASLCGLLPFTSCLQVQPVVQVQPPSQVPPAPQVHPAPPPRPIQEVRTVSCVLTTKESVLQGKREPKDHFDQKDIIRCYVALQWDDVAREAGRRLVTWNWYSGDKLISTHKKQVEFTFTPYVLWTTHAASSLGSGPFRVETLVDGKVVGAKSFDIAP